MIYLILDTNNWIYLANGLDPFTNKHHDNLHFNLLRALKTSYENGEILILVNDIIIDEWKRNKEHCRNKIEKLKNKLQNKENTFDEIKKYVKTELTIIRNEYNESLKNEIIQNEQHIKNVEDFLFNHCIKVEISQKTKLKIFDLSIRKDPPFHNKKNNVGDAAILLSTVEYLKEKFEDFQTSAIFVSNNIEEFTDQKDTNQFHPQLIPLLEGLPIKYARILSAALKLSQNLINEINDFNKFLVDLALAQFTWDIEEQKKGILMFLDVQYLNRKNNKEDYLTLCVAKEKNIQRPTVISIILPEEELETSEGLFLFFVKHDRTEDKKFEFDLENKFTIRIKFTDEDEETYKARILNGYVKNEENGIMIDFFQLLFEYDNLFLMYFNKDKSHQSIAVPLYTFQQQYSLLPY